MAWSEGTLAGSDRLVASPAAKAALRAARGGLRGRHGEPCGRRGGRGAGAPLLVIRAIADPQPPGDPARRADARSGRTGELRAGRGAREGCCDGRRTSRRCCASDGDSGRGFATLRRVAALAPPDLAFR